MSSQSRRHSALRARQYFVIAMVVMGFLVLAGRVVTLHAFEQDKIKQHADARHLREDVVLPVRGRIIDRIGTPLTISTPVKTLFVNPQLFCKFTPTLRQQKKLNEQELAGKRQEWILKRDKLLDELGLTHASVDQRCERYSKSGFMYLKKRLPPEMADKAMAHRLPGVYARRDYQRFYPGGPLGAHLIGFTDAEGHGQEGLELSFEDHLQGIAGRKLVRRDERGNFVEAVESIQHVEHGRDLQLTIDQRLQTLASSYLTATVERHQAAGGSAVMLDAKSGEILAMVTAPTFNPNDRSTIKGSVFRNRSVTDVMEPGSTVKPFTVAMALEKGSVNPDTLIDTSPGRYRIRGGTITDTKNHGVITVSEVIVKSSNIGSAKLALAEDVDGLLSMYKSVGFGSRALGLPGEQAGRLVRRTRPIEQATYSYGYGFTVTPLQLAQAYTALANDGVMRPVTLLADQAGQPDGVRVMSVRTARQVKAMLEQVTSNEGTARRARIARYRVAGKTGTTHKLIDGNYKNKRYQSLFAGFAPVSDPRFVMVVMVDDPRGKHYYGGRVAAPVFSQLMTDALRLYNVPPDAIDAVDGAAQLVELAEEMVQ